MNALHIAVCLKAIPDPEVPASDLQIDAAARRATAGSFVISPFDENALELALKLREATGSGHITAVSAGGAEATDRLRKALAAGADAMVRVEPPAEPDPYATAVLLAGAIHRLGDVQLVLAGRQAGDWDHGQVGGLLAELLGWPYLPFVFSLAPDPEQPGHLRAERETARGYALVRAPLPLVVSATNHAQCVLRLPKTRDLLRARQTPVTTWSAADLAATGAAAPGRTRLRSLQRVLETGRRCELLPGDGPAAQAEALAAWLWDRGLRTGGIGT